MINENIALWYNFEILICLLYFFLSEVRNTQGFMLMTFDEIVELIQDDYIKVKEEKVIPIF